jgi:predicted dehydrogenase
MRVGILGFGYTGQLHLRAWQATSGAQVVAIAETSADARARIPPGVKACSEVGEALAAGLDVVSICLPTYLHARAALQSFAAGAHVLVEKPIATNLEEADAMLRAAAAAGKTLFVGMTHRFYPEVVAAKQLLEEGAIGGLVMIRDCIFESLGFLDLAPWYVDPACAGGGAVLSSGIHLVDRVIWFAAEMPDWVVGAASSAFLREPIEDAAQMFLHFPSGLTAQLSFGLMAEAHPLICDLELIGLRGSIVVHTWKGYELRTGRGIERTDIYHDEPHTDKMVVGLRAEIAEFCQALAAGREPQPSAGASMRAFQVVNAFYRSVQSGVPERIIE